MIILHTDNAYKQTKKIRKGDATLNNDFIPLAEWILQTYKFLPLNVIYKKEKENKASLEIIFEFKEAENKFKLKGGSYSGLKRKQVADKFKELIKDEKYSADEIWVIFSSFEPVARAEVVDNIPDTEIEAFIRNHTQENIWEVNRFNSYITIFFYTEQQRKDALNNGLMETFREELYMLLKKYDEFGYFTKSNLSILLDSKENFDNNYSSNWWYYYK